MASIIEFVTEIIIRWVTINDVELCVGLAIEIPFGRFGYDHMFSVFDVALQLCGKLRRYWSEDEIRLVDVFYGKTVELDRLAFKYTMLCGLPSLKLFDDFSRHIFRVLITPS